MPQGFPSGSADKESTYNIGDLGLFPGLGRSPGEGKGYPLQHSGLENSVGCVVHGVAKSWTQLSVSHFISLHFHATCGIFPDQRSNLCPLNWEHRVLTTGPPRKSTFFFSYCVGRISGTFFNMNDGSCFCLNTDHKQKYSMCLH